MSASGAVTASTDVEALLLAHRVEQFLYAEAELLDERRFDEWFALFTLDCAYRAPVRVTREGADDVVGEGGLCMFDDDYGSLELRVQGLQVRSAWAEIPPSRARRLITNVRARPLDGGDIEAKSNFLVYRSRLETVEHLFTGTRVDRLKPVAEGAFQIRRRDILFDNVAFQTDNISLMF
ncbi:Benzene 1,2-dioxygenase subunit beta [Paraconexibacter sp. AEG42_29]|uniref:Benzene 1,2-dioxygenase subunit beta n=1 Tax=Paraconexibacter sp. AEG42_29 TaxID=2997339 RepID=A0AAU7B0H7_9ACTN